MKKNNPFSIQIDKNELKNLKDTFNSNIEAVIIFDDGLTVTMIVGTPKNLEYLMAKFQTNFYGPGLPWIIVRELTEKIIYEAITAYFEKRPNGYWLKLYYFWNELDITVFDQLDPLELDETDQLNLFIRLNQLTTELKKLNKIEESEKFNLLTNSNKLLKLFENFNFNSEKSSLQLDQQLTLAKKYLNFTKALLGFTSLLAIIQIFDIFSVS